MDGLGGLSGRFAILWLRRGGTFGVSHASKEEFGVEDAARVD